MTKLKSPVKEALKFREKIYIDLGSHWTLESCLWGRPEKSLGTPALPDILYIYENVNR